MKEIYAYECSVDLYRNNGMVFRTAKDQLYQRNTKGSYLVGAKTPKEAGDILQEAIGFGSITVKNQPMTEYMDFERYKIPMPKYKQVIRLEWKTENGRLVYNPTEPVHATAPQAR